MTRDSYHPVPVGLLLDEGSNPFEFACVCEVFGARRRPEIGRELYALQVIAPRRSVPVRDHLFTVGSAAPLSALRDVHTVFVPNRPDVDTPTRPSVLTALRDAHARGARIVGLCTGAFTLAEAGLLDHRPATVHWQLADGFRRRFPAVDLREDLLFVDDGSVLTSAGSAAALDLALHIVRTDHGAEVANAVSRRLVFSTYREGGQKQFVEKPVPDTHQRSLSSTLAWARGRLDTPLTVADLAAHACQSITTVHRRFRAELGTTPLAWLNLERVELARRLLETDAGGLDQVAARSGLGTASNLRRQIRRSTGLTPSQYRAACFRHSGPDQRTAVR
ncbi:helix-turn-helix domain-containing protein [Actinokineospora sp. PR83]|uniref:GlxA family transcriptional regulator n=1 Tax=Actinokineospora sp. PR83 TaxID=2884908 RepID=UPI001F2E932D|nr:helix-turn-helix domain-containing protein [Actinokineospora sp. PR83]MCG8914470.1 helix-turn-helix domain-containing protein [Actinokineospora sp. PR83]